MATIPTNDQVELALVSSKIVGEQQIEAAKKELERLYSTGDSSVSLAEVLVRQGVITDSIRRNLEHSSSDPLASVQSLGRYKLLKKLGQGGMGAVYLAEDSADNGKVAVKILPEKFASDPEFLARFRREAKAAGHLRHENIAAAYLEGDHNGVHYYTMEYCEGEPLDVIQKRNGALALGRALDIIIQVARGLKYAHDHGIIHRDIKPANICLSQTGVAKILDMGLSKDIACDELSFNTASGTVLGTAHYLSPEQAKGEKKIDGRADIYSLGATLYSLITGTTPFKGATQALVMMKHISDPLPNAKDLVPDTPDSVIKVIHRMMAKNPDDRYHDCGEVIQDLEKIQASLPKVVDPNAAGWHDETKSAIRRPAAGALSSHEIAHAPTVIKPAAPKPVQESKSKAPLLIGAGLAAAAIAIAIFFATRGNSTAKTGGTIGATTVTTTITTAVERPAPVEKPTVAAVSSTPVAPAPVQPVAVAPAPPVAPPVAPPPVPTPPVANEKQWLLKEEFETVDLANAPAGWKFRKPETLAIDAVEGHGKVLRMGTVNHADDATRFDIPLDIAKVRGHTVEATVLAKSASAGKPGQANFQIHWVVPSGTLSGAPVTINPGTGDWNTFKLRHVVPGHATEAFIRIERNDGGSGAGDLYFDDLKVDLGPENAGAAAALEKVEANQPQKNESSNPVNGFKKLFGK